MHSNSKAVIDVVKQFRWVSVEPGRNGKKRIRFVRMIDGRKVKWTLRGPIGGPEFSADYALAIKGINPREEIALGPRRALQKAKQRVLAGLFPEGSLCWLSVQYFQSREFQSLAEGTQRTRRRLIEKVCMGPEKDGAPGRIPIESITRRSMIVGRDARADTPAAAKHFIGFFSKMFDWAVEQDLMENNPAQGIKPPKYEKKSHATWTSEQLAAYRAAHPKGTNPRLAFEIMYWTGFRVSDAVQFGKQHIKASGEIELSQQKTKHSISIPFPAPLAEYLEAVKHSHMVF